jgi:glutamate-1-semialdehyde 2,1-aminomutase
MVACLIVTAIDPKHVAALVERERARYHAEHAGSRQIHRQAEHLFGRVPMTWMSKWAGGFPIAFRSAQGNRITDVNERTYIDFALGDTGAMAGHSPQPTIRAVTERIATLGGITTMLPTEDAEWVGAELTRRFGLPKWSFTLSATDANRWAIRLARLVTGKPKLLVFSYCYHGSVDETFIVLGPDGRPVSRPGNVAPAVDPTVTTRVAEWNDLAAVERELAQGDVAAILTEPALTNIGIVLPEPGFLAGLRDLATRYGALLMIDETHTISAGPGGMTARDALQPDVFVIGKSIGGGIPCGAYGLSEDVADAVHRRTQAGAADIVDVGGVGGTLAGNALSLAAMRATLGEVLTGDAFDHMIRLATRYTDEVQAILDDADMPWSITQLGARAEYRFVRPAPRTGGESAAAADDALDEYMHLYTLNRGILMTPFHNMALMCPDTSDADVARHTEVFGEAVGELVG